MLSRFIKIALGLIGVMLAAIALILVSARLLAQEDTQGLTIRPAIIDLAAIDETNETEVIIENSSPNSIAVKATVEPFVVNDPLTNPIERSRYDISTWIDLPEDSWLINSGDQVVAKIIVTPPGDPTPGGHYGQIAFRVVSGEADTTASGAIVRPEVVSLLFITVPGGITEHLEITQVVQQTVTLSGEVRSEVTLKNLGNVHLLVRPVLRVGSDDTPSSSEEAEIQVITPGTERVIEINHSVGGLFKVFDTWTDAFYGSPTVSASTDATQVIVISPFLIGVLLFGLIAGVSIYTGRTSSISRLNYSADKKKTSRRAGGYRHPKTASEKKIIKSNK